MPRRRLRRRPRPGPKPKPTKRPNKKPTKRPNKKPTKKPTKRPRNKKNCPAGYKYSSKDISGKGKKFSYPGKGVKKCARACDKRKGCTGFEYNWSGNERFMCGTYTGGKSNLRGTRKGAHKNWNTCLKVAPKCPSGYKGTSKDVDGKGKKFSYPGKGISKCAKACNKRKGCTAFEYNWEGNEKYKCGTYTGGKSNLQGVRKGKHTSWNTCLKSGVSSALSVDDVYDHEAFEFDEGSRFGEFGFYAMWLVAFAPLLLCLLINAYYARKYRRNKKAKPYEKVDLIADDEN